PAAAAGDQGNFAGEVHGVPPYSMPLRHAVIASAAKQSTADLADDELPAMAQAVAPRRKPGSTYRALGKLTNGARFSPGSGVRGAHKRSAPGAWLRGRSLEAWRDYSAACSRSRYSSYTAMFLPNEIAAAWQPETRCIHRHGSRVLRNSSTIALWCLN